MAEIRLENLTKEYESPERDSIVAVSDLDLEINDGELLVLVGPSGCGKTTTLRCTAGLEQVTEGRIWVGNEDMTHRDASERKMAMVFQNFALYPHMTARENIEFALKLGGSSSRSEIDERVKDATTMLEISDLLNKKPGNLSGGQQQRVALARAIVREPEAFLFDEPLSSLDAKLRTQMRTEIQRLQKDLEITSVYVTHDQTEAMTMGDRIAILNDGQLQQVGTPEEVYSHPTNQFVAGFIGDPSMNFHRTTFEISDEQGILEFGGQQYTVSEGGLDALRNHGCSEIVAGIRPEDFTLVTDPERHDHSKLLELDVDVLEQLGNQNLLYTTIGGDEFTCRISGNAKPEEGITLLLTFEEDYLYLFDLTGESIKTREDTSQEFYSVEALDIDATEQEV
jgi:multiple sugar transport system ATP-binding protein